MPLPIAGQGITPASGGIYNELQSVVRRAFIPNLIVPTTLAMQVSKRLSRSNLVRPGTKRFRLPQPAQLAINPDEDFLKDVFSPMLVFHEAHEVAKQRLLNTLEEFVQSLVAAGLRLQHPPAFALRRCLIGHALIRPADLRLGSKHY